MSSDNCRLPSQDQNSDVRLTVRGQGGQILAPYQTLQQIVTLNSLI